MKNLLPVLTVTLLLTAMSCSHNDQPASDQVDTSFSKFEDRFLDAYWKQHPSYAIFVGYGKYYDRLTIPDSAAVAANIAFAKSWIDSLNLLDITSPNSKAMSGMLPCLSSRNGMLPSTILRVNATISSTNPMLHLMSGSRPYHNTSPTPMPTIKLPQPCCINLQKNILKWPCCKMREAFRSLVHP